MPKQPHSSKDHSAALRGFGPLGLLAIAVVFLGNGLFVPLSGILVLAWAHLSRTPFSELGFVRPSSWTKLILAGVVGGALLKLLFKSVIMPLLGTPPINAQFAYLTGNAAALPGMVAFILVGAGFGEETVYRGFLFERMRKILGASQSATVAIVLGSSAVFAAVHSLSQGIFGVAQAFLLGVLLGCVYAWTRTIWSTMLLHASFDLTALALIFTGTEHRVSTLFFAP